MHWLYHSTLYVKEKEDASAYKDITIHKEKEQLLCKLYFLGNQIQDDFFKNCVIDAIADLTVESHRALASVTEVDDNTLPGDKLRMLVVDMHVWSAHPGWIRETTWDGPKEYWKQRCSEMVKVGETKYAKDSKHPWIVHRCRYHTHGDGKKCMFLGEN